MKKKTCENEHFRVKLYNEKNSTSGITLIALVVTIVVLLILAGVSLNLVIGNNGIINKAKDSREQTLIAKEKEDIQLAYGAALTNNLGYTNITDSDLQTELDKIAGDGKTLVSTNTDGSLNVLYHDTGNNYTIENGNIANENTEKLAAGLYDKNDVLIYGWQELLDKGWLTVQNGVLTSGYVSKGNPNVDNIDGKLVIDSSVTEIGTDGLNGLSKMFACVLPDNVVLGNWSFNNTGITSVGEYGSGAAVELPKGVTKLPQGIFYECANLTEINIPASVVDIGNCLGGECPKLQRYNVAPDNPKFMDIDGVCYSKSGKTLIAYPVGKDCTNFVIPSTVERIGVYAFYGTNINEISIPATVKTMGYCAFNNCSNLTKVVIGSGINSILGSTFADCANLSEISLPDSLNTIGYRAFMGPNKIQSITIPANVNKIDAYAFGYVNAQVSFANVSTITTVGESAFSNSTLTDSDKQAILNCNSSACDKISAFGGIKGDVEYTFNGVE